MNCLVNLNTDPISLTVIAATNAEHARLEALKGGIVGVTLTAVTPPEETFAGELYTTYCRAVGGKAFNGDPLPDWKTFRADPTKQKQSDAWLETARVAMQAQSFFQSNEPPAPRPY